MCLAVPAKLVEVDGASATADLHGNRIAISTILEPDAAVGDWVLLHAGFAIQRIDAEAARRMWAVLEDLDDAIGANPTATAPDAEEE